MSHHKNPRALLTPLMRGLLDRMARIPQSPGQAIVLVGLALSLLGDGIAKLLRERG